tara:strand:+ start:49141 stop:49833 length:693 start_codon:yes stop_codon:yes gene_type:complete
MIEKNTSTKVTACVFDAYGTLFNFNAATKKFDYQLGGSAEELNSIWRAKQIEYTWLSTLMKKYSNFWELTGCALDFAMDSVGIEDKELREGLMQAYLRLDAYPEITDVLRILKAGGIKVAILSNGEPIMLENAVKSANIGEFVDHIISVDEISLYKPHPSVYQLAVDQLNIPVEQICFQSSNSWDALGAKSFGFKVVWCNRFGLVKERLGKGFDYETDDLTPLPKIIGLA